MPEYRAKACHRINWLGKSLGHAKFIGDERCDFKVESSEFDGSSGVSASASSTSFIDEVAATVPTNYAKQ
jgi:hypothetical protein